MMISLIQSRFFGIDKRLCGSFDVVLNPRGQVT